MLINYIKFKENTVFEITELISEMSYVGSTSQASRSLKVKIINNNQTCKCGDLIQFIDNGINYVGRIMECELSKDGKCYDVECNDGLIHLSNSYTTRVEGGSAKEIAIRLCNEVGIGHQYIEDKNVIQKVFEKKTYYDILKDIYGDMYQISMIGALLSIKHKGWTTSYILNDSNIIDIHQKDDIKDIKNKVIYYDDKGKIIKEEKNETIEKYGHFQNIGENDSNNSSINIDNYYWWTDEEDKKNIDTPTITQKKTLALNKYIKDIKNELSITAIGDNTCVSGNYIRYKDIDTNIIGLYEIVNDSHTYRGQSHTMDLILEFIGII